MMPPMTLERFRDLADAYGAEIARWPAPERAAALHLAGQPAAIAILAQAAAIDAQLDAWTLPAPAMALRGRVVRAAPVRGPALALWARLWWSGLGFGAALAGALAGAAAVAMAPAIDASSDTGTTFGVVDSQDR